MDTNETLHCPADSKRSTGGSGYQTLADNLLRFSEIGCLPKSVAISRLDDGDGIESTFQHHRAKWHDSCRLQYNKTQLTRAEKRKTTSENTEGMTRKYTRQSVDRTETVLETCFFCDKQAGNESLRKASTFDLDRRVRNCALKLEDKSLIAKLSAGNMMAQDALYHVKCLVSLYNRTRDTKRNLDDQDDINHGIAFGELVSYIDDARMDSLVAPVFKLADLTGMYSNRLKQLGTVLPVRVHSTKLKYRIMAYFPDMEEHKPGRDVLLAFNEDIGSALHKACQHDADSDGVHLARAANIVRRDILKMKTAFSGSFDALCQEQSVPKSLLALVAMILNGPTIQEQSSHSSVSTPALTVSQLLMFNSIARRRQSTSIESTKHGHNRETPLPVYLGMLMHTKTRKRDLVDTLFHLGLSVSYDRVLSISTDLGNNICRFFQQEGAVCPPELKVGLFTTGAVDNIDHNPSSTSAQDSFHGTGISLFQHPNSGVRGVKRPRVSISDEATTTKTTAHLPESYTTVPPVFLGKRELPLPKLDGPNRSDCQLIPQAMKVEYRYATKINLFESCTYSVFIYRIVKIGKHSGIWNSDQIGILSLWGDDRLGRVFCNYFMGLDLFLTLCDAKVLSLVNCVDEFLSFWQVARADGCYCSIRHTPTGRRSCVMGCISCQQAVHSRGTRVRHKPHVIAASLLRPGQVCGYDSSLHGRHQSSS